MRLCKLSLALFVAGVQDAAVRKDDAHVYPTAQEIFVLANPVQLEQVLVNLIGNALHAVKDNEQRHINISAEISDQEVIFKIWDNGPGIEEEHLLMIFDPFFTTKKEGGGLGLGLSISYRLVEGMNGQLQAENHPDGAARHRQAHPHPGKQDPAGGA